MTAKAPAYVFLARTEAPEGIDTERFRVRLLVDRKDGSALSTEDIAALEAVFPETKPQREQGGGSGVPAKATARSKKPTARPKRKAAKRRAK